jgi:hypothetical protein
MHRRLARELIALAVCLAASAGAMAGAAPAVLIGQFDWDMDEAWFGGLSGIHMAADGQSATLLNDRGLALRVALDRDGAGAVDGIRLLDRVRLKSSAGVPVRGKLVDSEGLAIGTDGRIYISYEGVHRVARHSPLDGAARVLPDRPDFRLLSSNAGLEALAIDTAGRLYAVPEGGRDTEGAIPVFVFSGGAWSVSARLPASGGFDPVGADIGPDGRFYLLERRFGPLGFQTRLRRWTLSGTAFDDEQMLLRTPWGVHDNLEGLSVWRDGSGKLIATMVSDDNFSVLQRTELVEYALPD